MPRGYLWSVSGLLSVRGGAALGRTSSGHVLPTRRRDTNASVPGSGTAHSHGTLPVGDVWMSMLPSNKNHWSECGRATPVANSDVLDRPHRSVPALGARTAEGRVSIIAYVSSYRLGHLPWWANVIIAVVIGAFIWALVRKLNSDD